MNGYFEKINKNKYLMLVPTNESKENCKNMKKFGVKSGSLVKDSDDYDEKYMKTKFNLDDDLSLNKVIEIRQ